MNVVTRFKLVTHQLLVVHTILTINMVSLRTGEVSDSLMNWTFSPTGKWRNPSIILKLLRCILIAIETLRLVKDALTREYKGEKGS